MSHGIRLYGDPRCSSAAVAFQWRCTQCGEIVITAYSLYPGQDAPLALMPDDWHAIDVGQVQMLLCPRHTVVLLVDGVDVLSTSTNPDAAVVSE